MAPGRPALNRAVFGVAVVKLLFCRTKTPGPGAQSALRALARSGMKIGRIGELVAGGHPDRFVGSEVASVHTLLKMSRYCSTILCHYWDTLVK